MSDTAKQNQLHELKHQLGSIEQTMSDRWVSAVRELWGVRDEVEEAAFCPDVGMHAFILPSKFAGDVEIIRATPKKASNNAFIYAHGGDWISPLNKDHVKWAKYFAQLSNYTVFIVEYKLCPEHPFPAGLHDIIATYQHALEQGFNKVSIGGDSSGGNLSVATALYAKDHHLPLPDKILDICSFHDFYFEQYNSAQTLGLEKNSSIDMRLVGFNRACYVPYLKDWKHPYASPIYADVTDFPDTFVFVAGADPLCDDNIAFANKLERESNNTVLLKVYPDMPHSFHCHMDIAPQQAERANQDLVDFLLG